MTGRPDEVVCHEPGRCRGCGGGLSGARERQEAMDAAGVLPSFRGIAVHDWRNCSPRGSGTSATPT